MLPPKSVPRKKVLRAELVKPDAAIVQQRLLKAWHIDRLFKHFELLVDSPWTSARELAQSLLNEMVRRRGKKWVIEMRRLSRFGCCQAASAKQTLKG